MVESSEFDHMWEIHEGDAVEHLAKLPSDSVDVICTDPPYNLGSYSTGNISLPWRKTLNNDIAAWDQGNVDPTTVAHHFERVLKPTGNLFIFTSYNLIGTWHTLLDPLYDTFQFAVWHKTNPPPKVYRAGFLNSCELIVCAWNKGHTWNFGKQSDMHNFFEGPICSGHERLKNPHHPTQKPVAVLKWLLELSTQPGAVVLDPFAGVASTGVAALSLGLRFIGVEREPEYCKASVSRLTDIALDLQSQLPFEGR